MQILVFCHYYPPEVNAPASRTSEHARVWAEAGHEVMVITCAPNHPAGKLFPGYSNSFTRETIDGVNVVRVWSYLAPNAGFARRIANYLSYMISALAAVPRVDKPDVIISTSPQFFCGLAGLGAKWMRRVPWVLEIRDLWPDSIVTVGAMKKGRLTRFLEWLERMAYRKADHVVAVTDGFVPHIAARRGRPGVSVIKNGVNFDLFQKGCDPEAVKARFGMQGRKVAAYVGTHGVAHGLDIVLDAAARLREDSRIGFVLVGDGAERARLEARAAQMDLPNLHIAGQLPKSEMPAIWSATDVSLIVLRKSDTFKTVLPSKMFEAMAMECPIVLGVEGEARALLDEAGVGIGIEPGNADALAEAVLRIVDSPSEAEQFSANGLAHVRAHFDRRALALSYLDLLEDMRR